MKLIKHKSENKAIKVGRLCMNYTFAIFPLNTLYGCSLTKKTLTQFLSASKGKRVILYSAHDTVLVPILAALDLYPSINTVPYVADLSFELYRSASGKILLFLLHANYAIIYGAYGAELLQSLPKKSLLNPDMSIISDTKKSVFLPESWVIFKTCRKYYSQNQLLVIVVIKQSRLANSIGSSCDIAEMSWKIFSLPDPPSSPSRSLRRSCSVSSPTTTRDMVETTTISSRTLHGKMERFAKFE